MTMVGLAQTEINNCSCLYGALANLDCRNLLWGAVIPNACFTFQELASPLLLKNVSFEGQTTIEQEVTLSLFQFCQEIMLKYYTNTGTPVCMGKGSINSNSCPGLRVQD